VEGRAHPKTRQGSPVKDVSSQTAGEIEMTAPFKAVLDPSPPRELDQSILKNVDLTKPNAMSTARSANRPWRNLFLPSIV